MKKLFASLVLSSMSLFALAQSTGKITGLVKDGGNKKIIDAASISLLKAKDSSLVKTSVTDKDGNFLFDNVKEGSYLVVASSIGHAKVYSSVITISAENSSATTGALQLLPNSRNMSEVV